MGIGPSTKETTLHHFRDPLLEVVAADTDLDLMGIIIVGTPDDNKDKLLVGTRTAVWAEAMRADGVILMAGETATWTIRIPVSSWGSGEFR